MKTKIRVLPVYFYEESEDDKKYIELIESDFINFQKLVKSLLKRWLEEKKGLSNVNSI